MQYSNFEPNSTEKNNMNDSNINKNEKLLSQSIKIYNYMLFPGNHSDNIGKILIAKGNFLEVI